jgi:hypothetical protein
MDTDPFGLPGMPLTPWVLKTTDGKAEYRAFRDARLDPPSIVVLAGKKELRYHLRCLDDLYEMLKERVGWVSLGCALEGEQAEAGSVEEWARSSRNPLGSWYGLKKGSRGEFALYIPPIMHALNLAEVEEGPGGRMRAV